MKLLIEFLSRRQVAERVGLSTRTVDRIPELLKIRLSPRRVGYDADQVEAWMTARVGVR